MSEERAEVVILAANEAESRERNANPQPRRASGDAGCTVELIRARLGAIQRMEAGGRSAKTMAAARYLRRIARLVTE